MVLKLAPKNKEELRLIIKAQLKIHGNYCSLNHIEVGRIMDMSYLFYKSDFDGDISEWNVSNLLFAKEMFMGSKFNGNISRWNTEKLTEASFMFCNSEFRSDISAWNVKNLRRAEGMFLNAPLSYSLNDWEPINLRFKKQMFDGVMGEIPYWYSDSSFDDTEIIREKIALYKKYKYLDKVIEKNPQNIKNKKQNKI